MTNQFKHSVTDLLSKVNQQTRSRASQPIARSAPAGVSNQQLTLTALPDNSVVATNSGGSVVQRIDAARDFAFAKAATKEERRHLLISTIRAHLDLERDRVLAHYARLKAAMGTETLASIVGLSERLLDLRQEAALRAIDQRAAFLEQLSAKYQAGLITEDELCSRTAVVYSDYQDHDAAVGAATSVMATQIQNVLAAPNQAQR
jgi:hypothetical protein